jgi:hypothetical protein
LSHCRITTELNSVRMIINVQLRRIRVSAYLEVLDVCRKTHYQLVLLITFLTVAVQCSTDKEVKGISLMTSCNSSLLFYVQTF